MLRRAIPRFALPPEYKMLKCPVIFVKTTLGPEGGFAGEEREVAYAKGEEYLKSNICVPVNEENRRAVWAWNPDTDQFDRFIQRDEAFLEFQSRKRQWLNVYWRVNQTYLMFMRQAWGQGYIINCPLRKRDISQKLWEQLKVRVDPRLIEFREKDRRTGIQDLGHNFCWLHMPGAEELQVGNEVYDNSKVKIRLHVRRGESVNTLY